MKIVSGKISKTQKVFFENCKIFYQELHLSQYIKLLLDPILIVGVSFMIKCMVCLFTKSWNAFSIIPAWSLLEPYLRDPYIKRQALPRTRFRVTPIKTLVQKVRSVLQNRQYLFKLTPEKTSSYVTRNAVNIPLLNMKHNSYKKSFFPSLIIEWNNLDPNLQNSENFGIFKKNILKFIRPKPNSFFNCCHLKEVRLITRLRLS